MVGVPGRSKACHTCRQRRIKCGAEKPSCSNCARSNRQCAGYQRKHAFVLAENMLGDDSALQVPPLNEADSGVVVVSRWRMGADGGRHTPPRPPRPAKKPVQLVQEASRIPPLVSSRNIMRDQLVRLFVGHHVPEGVWSGRRQPQSWLVQISELPTLEPALERALMASGAALLRQEHGESTLVTESLAMYTRSLHELQRAVSQPNTRRSDQTLAASVALTMYELAECPGELVEGYLAHYGGAMELVKLRGPGSHASGMAHDLFQTLRLHSVYHGISWDQPSFLTEPEWLRKPWSTPKSPTDQVIDIMLEFPALFALGRKAREEARPQMSIHASLRLYKEYQKLDDRLTDWMTAYQRTIAGPLYHASLTTLQSKLDSPTQGRVFPVSFHFPSFIVGYTMLLYWVAQIIVHFHICRLRHTLAEAAPARAALPCQCTGGSEANARPACPQHVALPALHHRAEWAQLCRHICQAAEYFLAPRMGAVGPAALLPGLGLVRAYLGLLEPRGRWTREVRWAEEMLGRIRRRGNALAGHVEAFTTISEEDAAGGRG